MSGLAIRSRVTFLSAEEGGRSRPPGSGYRPPVWFGARDAAGDPILWDWEFTFLDALVDGDEEAVRFGEEILTTMRAVSASEADVPVSAGAAFEVHEGARVVARGTVEEVLQA